MPDPFDRLAKAPPEPGADSAALLLARMKQTGQIELGDLRLTDLNLAPPRSAQSSFPWIMVGVMALGVVLLVTLGILPLRGRLAELESALATAQESAAALRVQVEQLSAKSAGLETVQKALTSEVELKASEHDQWVRAGEEHAAEERRKLAEKSKKVRKKKVP